MEKILSSNEYIALRDVGIKERLEDIEKMFAEAIVNLNDLLAYHAKHGNIGFIWRPKDSRLYEAQHWDRMIKLLIEAGYSCSYSTKDNGYKVELK